MCLAFLIIHSLQLVQHETPGLCAHVACSCGTTPWRTCGLDAGTQGTKGAALARLIAAVAVVGCSAVVYKGLPLWVIHGSFCHKLPLQVAQPHARFELQQTSRDNPLAYSLSSPEERHVLFAMYRAVDACHGLGSTRLSMLMIHNTAMSCGAEAPEISRHARGDQHMPAL